VLDYRLETLDPAVLTRQVVAEFEQEGNARGHSIECTGDASLPRVRVDREALGSVLWNLLDNAVKYSPDQPRCSSASGGRAAA